MSYSFSVSAGEIGDFAGKFDEAAEKAIGQVGEEFQEAVREHVAAIKAAVGVLIESGVIASGGQHVSMTVSGHANPGHEPKSGWGNDQVSLNLTQQNPAPAA